VTAVLVFCEMAPTVLLASDAAFGIVFGVFVAALAVLGFVAIRWGVRRDRPGRQAWRQRHLDAAAGRNGAQQPGEARDHQ
jgi:hypothetical protein